MNTSFLINHRLVNQHIGQSRFANPEEIVQWLVAMQAQEFAMAKWAIGLRLPGTTEETIDRAFAEGKILRTHLMRPTWHFVSPKDIRWLISLTASRINALSAYMYRQLELGPEIFKQCNKILEKELRDHKSLTRSELKTILEKKKILADGLRLGYLMMRAEIDGVICSGPRRGKQFTYALLEDRVPAVAKLSREEALIQFTSRYFSSRGPATLKDFATWSGLAMQDVKTGVAHLSRRFIRERWKDQEYIFENADLPTAIRKNFLMPIYDEYGMAYKDRSHLFNPKINPSGSTIFNNLIVLEGAAAGGWTRNTTNSKLTIETFPFVPLNKSKAATLTKETNRFMKFHGK